MATAVQKITLSSSRDIPFNKLVLSQSNVRRVKAGVSIEELADDIARRTLLQSLSVRASGDAGWQRPDRVQRFSAYRRRERRNLQGASSMKPDLPLPVSAHR